MKTMNMNDVMSNKDYTMIMDGTAPLGMAKFRYEPTQEIVYVVVNEKLARANNNATINNNAQTDKNETTMNNTNKNNTQVTNNNTQYTQEEKKMTFKERWLKAIKKGQDMGYAAAHKTGYGIGYATTTVKEEVAYMAKKVANTKGVQLFVNGYHDGKSDAQYAFAQRCIRREEKARERADAKAARLAADELFDEFEDEDFDFE